MLKEIKENIFVDIDDISYVKILQTISPRTVIFDILLKNGKNVQIEVNENEKEKIIDKLKG